MTDLLFIELGAVVTETKGTNQCTIEPYCGQNEPTYLPNNRVDVNFADSVGNVSPANALYDQIVYPASNREQIGPSWPGAGHEGILCARESLVHDNGILSAAATTLTTLRGPRCRYQVIASIADNNDVQRYHGFVAEVVLIDNMIVFKLVDVNGHTVDTPIKYTPNGQGMDAKFYTGYQVDGYTIDGNVVRGTVPVGTQGVVFMNLDAFDQVDRDWIIAVAPKQPPGAGL
jgi:hypothetical protein